ncbi:MAG: nucleotide exchange factor GrpE [Rikenellaceae bacterium]|nr:nucleotide exchange factor GrpE [Rikenellaceae bacterium]MBR2451681.1 nucleotide exchange factor GrpE [Rikenellaceae bacterium]
MAEGEGSAQDAVTLALAEAAGWKDKYIRLQAEFDNYRKRTLKEKMDLVASGGEDVIKSLLGVMDDLDRALNAVRTASDVDALRAGVEMIDSKFREVLRNKGVEEIEAVGKEFDVDVHEAVAKIPAPDADSKGKIVDVVQKGYKLKDKVVRYAKVVVGE